MVTGPVPIRAVPVLIICTGTSDRSGAGNCSDSGDRSGLVTGPVPIRTFRFWLYVPVLVTGLVLVTAPIAVTGLVLVTGPVPIGTFLVLVKGTGTGD